VPLLRLSTIQLYSLADRPLSRVSDLFGRALTVPEKWFDLRNDVLTSFKSRFSFFPDLDFPGYRLMRNAAREAVQEEIREALLSGGETTGRLEDNGHSKSFFINGQR
jgi:hypothetical protein